MNLRLILEGVNLSVEFGIMGPLGLFAFWMIVLGMILLGMIVLGMIVLRMIVLGLLIIHIWSTSNESDLTYL